MTADDFAAFYIAYERLCVQLQHKTSAPESKAYFQALRVYPLATLQVSADQLSRDGTRTGWFLTTPQWAEAADEILETQDRQDLDALARGAGPERRFLPLPTADTREATKVEQKGIRTARAAFLRDLRKNGWRGLARVFRAVPLSGTRHDHCPDCWDTGTLLKDGWASPCACRGENPVVLKAAEIRQREAARARRRRRHAIA